MCAISLKIICIYIYIKKRNRNRNFKKNFNFQFEFFNFFFVEREREREIGAISALINFIYLRMCFRDFVRTFLKLSSFILREYVVHGVFASCMHRPHLTYFYVYRKPRDVQ